MPLKPQNKEVLTLETIFLEPQNQKVFHFSRNCKPEPNKLLQKPRTDEHQLELQTVNSLQCDFSWFQWPNCFLFKKKRKGHQIFIFVSVNQPELWKHDQKKIASYSQIWLLSSLGMINNFLHFPMDDCHLDCIEEFLKKTTSGFVQFSNWVVKVVKG